MKAIGLSPTSLKTARASIFAALYVVTSLIPISTFIGAPSFLSLNLIITPVMAFLLAPSEALISSIIGGLISLYLSPTQAMFGPITILLPVSGATLGSLAVHKGKLGKLAAAGFLTASMLAYLTRNHSFPYFVSPHTLALCILAYGTVREMTPLKLKAPINAFVSTMCEQGMMMIFATHLLHLPAQIFSGILPLMLYERIVATIGASIIIIAIIRTFTNYFDVKN